MIELCYAMLQSSVKFSVRFDARRPYDYEDITVLYSSPPSVTMVGSLQP